MKLSEIVNAQVYNIILLILVGLLLNFQAQALPQGPFILKEMIWQKGGNPDYPLQPPLGWNLIGKMPIFSDFDGTGWNFTGKMPVFADLDGDGDLDLTIATKGMLKDSVKKDVNYGASLVWDKSGVPPAYFENIGTPTSPRFTQRWNKANPWEKVEAIYIDAYDNEAVLYWSAILTALDLDHDGDVDFISGGGIVPLDSEAANSLAYIENIGTPREPYLVWRDGTSNPWYGIEINCPPSSSYSAHHSYLKPVPFDWDADGDWDLLTGCHDGNLFYLENIGDATTPRFVNRTGVANPWDGINIGAFSHLVALDLDADGDADMVLSNASNELVFIENTGVATAPSFIEPTDTNNPWDGLTVESYIYLAPADLDADGDWDLVYTNGLSLAYFENMGDSHNPRFEPRVYPDNPFGGLDAQTLGGVAKDIALFDPDGDGDLDLILGNPWIGMVDYFENTATPGELQFLQRYGADNPFANLSEGGIPVPVDLDEDGDLDLVLGRDEGRVAYIENTGDAHLPRWEERDEKTNPFSHIDVRYSTAYYDYDSPPTLEGIAVPFFLDIDGDGDQDLLVSNNSYSYNYTYYKVGNLFFSENIGSTSMLQFASEKFIDYSFPESYYRGMPGRGVPVDFDHDGDQDLIIGGIQGIDYVENTGSATAPVFTLRDGADNPWHGLNAGAGCSAAPLDLEGDGDWDLLATNDLGVLLLFENKNLPAHERAFNWAESVVPELLPPPGDAFELPQMSLRYYAASGVYLFYHSTDGQAYLFAPPYAEWQALGTLENYAEAILAAGF